MDERRKRTGAALGVAIGAALIAFAVTHATPRAASATREGRYRVDAATAKRDGVPVLPAGVRAGTFRFGADVAPADRDAVLSAVARARPEARHLVGLVDGLVDVSVGATDVPGTIGITEPGARYGVTLDLGVVSRLFGQRGIDRLVLHELGHVVDFALVPDDTMTQLQAGIPEGYGCDLGNSGACANPRERFAESFAKWATGDIGVDLGEGYKVPPPGPTLDAWGAPLARLGELR